jgi:predicted Zn-dependent protease
MPGTRPFIVKNFRQQAVVAHELGHEYYWNEFEDARQKHDYSQVQELELRCDAIAVITLQSVGVDPECLISAITKLNKHNERPGSPSSPNYVELKDRITFIRSIADMLRARRTRQSVNGAK